MWPLAAGRKEVEADNVSLFKARLKTFLWQETTTTTEEPSPESPGVISPAEFRTKESNEWLSIINSHIYLKAKWDMLLFQKSVANWVPFAWLRTHEVVFRFKKVGDPLSQRLGWHDAEKGNWLYLALRRPVGNILKLVASKQGLAWWLDHGAVEQKKLECHLFWSRSLLEMFWRWNTSVSV